MSDAKGFLLAKVANYDLIMVKVMSSPHPQSFRARVERIYAARKGIDVKCLGSEIEFVGCPAHWGQEPLKVGNLALLFVKLTAGRMYEDAWHGHMVVEELDGTVYAIYQHRELWRSDDVPASIRDSSRQDPKRPNATAICFDALETYLLTLIEQVDGSSSQEVI